MSLIAHWPIDYGTSRDTTNVRDIAEGGSGNHDGGFTFGYYSYWMPGGVGNRNIGPVSQYGGWTTVTNNADDFRVTGEMSIAMWAACDQYSGWNDQITLASCSHDNDGTPANNSLWAFNVYQRKLRFMWWDGVSAWTIVSTTDVVTSRQGFQHFAAVRYEISAGYYGVKFYVDGVMVEDVDNGGAGFAGPTNGENAIMYIGRRKDFVNTYQSDLWYDSVYFYNLAVADTVIADIYAEEFPQVHPELSAWEPKIQDPEETAEGSIYIVQEIDQDPNANDDQEDPPYDVVDASPSSSGSEDRGAYRVIDTGPLNPRTDAGWKEVP